MKILTPGCLKKVRDCMDGTVALVAETVADLIVTIVGTLEADAMHAALSGEKKMIALRKHGLWYQSKGPSKTDFRRFSRKFSIRKRTLM